jgi:hypothetical protein
MEGIHALNPEMTPGIPDDTKFKIYVSALTTISIDAHNWIPTTDTRLLRRIIRDYRFRNYSARETIARWPSVRRGEEKWIFPYQENADVMFNSALLFELAVLKKHAALGHCALKGTISRPLVKESRAGSTDTSATTEWIVLDLDGLPPTVEIAGQAQPQTLTVSKNCPPAANPRQPR